LLTSKFSFFFVDNFADVKFLAAFLDRSIASFSLLYKYCVVLENSFSYFSESYVLGFLNITFRFQDPRFVKGSSI
jgi:hypothetical protein